ncbi:Serine/threonine protein kinase [Streptomyces zhaozhouensis]|uniref:Serine/threonine protein kinase n=1 Tax=Streptomyces zhaozhouensis TaxID=1300267 RepID=A0A286E0I4_9ACTN|nr:serine/threonine-protein kinase [Streptomyces zhaozhouensis]SOD64394.1 Serine/threonine protein kinase [Streptomyces zhaozhouensis]
MATELAADDPRRVGRYRITGRLGAGGMGRVYLGRSPGGRLVAVKVVRPELSDDPGFRTRFAREVAAARKVTGLFTAAVVDADPEAPLPWLATAYVPGPALDEAVARHGPWPVEAVRALGAGLAEALEAIHAAGLVHRDLKPSNVLIAPDGPRVVDFGVSVAVEATQLTRTGTVLGTPGFMAPEQLSGRTVSPATDVFSLGAVLTHAATGTGPFGTGSAQSLNFRIAYERPVLDALPAALREVVAGCLEKDPSRRPDLASLLDELASDDPDFTPFADLADLADASVPAGRPPTRVATPGTTRPSGPLAGEPDDGPAGEPARGTAEETADGATERATTRRAPAGPPEPPTALHSPTPPGAGPPPALLLPARRDAALRRVALALWCALVAISLAMVLPAVDGDNVVTGLSDGSWPFAVAAALCLTSCGTVLGLLPRVRRGAALPDGVRAFHGTVTVLTGTLLAVFVVGGPASNDLGPGVWSFVLGTLAMAPGALPLAAADRPDGNR